MSKSHRGNGGSIIRNFIIFFVLLTGTVVAVSRYTTTRPSPLEIFNPHQRCAWAARRYTNPDYAPDVTYSAPYYNVEENRCYILQFATTGPTNPVVNTNTVLDVQTGEVVALTYENGKGEGGNIEGHTVSYREAEARIKKLMGEKKVRLDG